MTRYKLTAHGSFPFTEEEETQANLDISTALQNQKNLARVERNSLLLSTDWTQAKDVSDSVSSKWAPYRQALRDVPQQPGFPTDITWPVQPE